MEDRVGGGDAVRRRLERQVTVDRRLESRVDAYGTLLTGARGGTSPGCIVPRLAGQSGRLQCLAHMEMYSIINISRGFTHAVCQRHTKVEKSFPSPVNA